MHAFTALQQARLRYLPLIPSILKDTSNVIIEKKTENIPLEGQLKLIFPKSVELKPVAFVKGPGNSNKKLSVGVVFSGGQAPGGHNVIAALFDELKKGHAESVLYGFIDGPQGIISNKTIVLTKERIDLFRNQGGFDLIGSGRTKIETEEQFKSALQTCLSLSLDGLVIIGGDDSNTNAALLAEYFFDRGCHTSVVGVPKTIDGDLQSDEIDISFGFDTASKVYSELIGNILRDALSAKKYYHFIKLMGRSASHITIECALQTQPNYTIILEEVAKENKTLDVIVGDIADLIAKRADCGKNYGAILIPEGLIEFIPEVMILIQELNKYLVSNPDNFKDCISKESLKLLESLPQNIQKQLVKDRDPHGNVQVAHIETEKLLIEKVSQELKKRKKEGRFSGSFNALSHYYGYEGRASLPTNFDSNYCYTLGVLSYLSILNGLSGYIVYVKNLSQEVEKWQFGAVPLIAMMNIEERKGKRKAVIKKALVDLQGKPFLHFKSIRKSLELDDNYLVRGPIQFFGDPSITDDPPLILS
jgi:pyrophosphate--fructose-6-phosphate 1-phosphotransferase